MSASFRGYALDDTNGVAFGSFGDTPGVDGSRVARLGDGATFERLSRSARTVDIRGTLHGDTKAELDDRARDLMAVLSDPSEGDLIIDTYKLACRSRPGKLSYRSIDHSFAADWSCRFESPDPYWEETPAATALKVLTNNGVSQESFSLTYGADLAESYPSFTIESLGASLITGYEITLRNDTTGEEFRLLDFDLGQNDILTVDPDSEQVYISTQTTGNAVAPRRVDGVFWALSGASLTIVVKHNQQGLTPNFRVTATARKWHHTYAS